MLFDNVLFKIHRMSEIILADSAYVLSILENVLHSLPFAFEVYLSQVTIECEILSEKFRALSALISLD